MSKRSAFLSLPLLVLGTAVPAAWGQADVFVYSVEVVCTQGQSNLPFTVQNGGVTEASETFVNLHNFTRSDLRFTFRAVQPRTGASSGAVFSPLSESLSAFTARTFNCGDFITLQQRPSTPSGVNPATEGFLVIESPARIQVAAVYRTRSLATALVDNGSSEVFWIGSKNVFGDGDLPKLEKVPAGRMSEEEMETIGAGRGSIEVPIVPMERRTKIQAAGMGLGLGAGASRGTGVGVGSGTSVDVEYVEPFVVRGGSGR